MISLGALVGLGMAVSAGAGPDSLLQYQVNGLRILHQMRPSTTDVMSVQLYLLGGARQITADNAGIEPLLLDASAYGTRKYPGEMTRRALARTGSAISVDASSDWTTFELDGLKQEFDSAWSVFADRLMQPTLDSNAIESVRRRMLGARSRRHTSPEAFAHLLADSVAFHNHPYAISPDGTERSLRALTADALRQYAREQMVTSRLLLVVVGDIPRAKVEQAVGSTLGTLPPGKYEWTLPERRVATKASVVAASRLTTTNYIVGTFLGPSRESREFPAFVRAVGFLSGWISYLIREEMGLSYSAGATMYDRGVASASIYMSTNRPDSAMKTVNRLLEVMSSPGVTLPRYILREGAKGYTTQYIRSTETASSHAAMLARALLYEGDPTAAARKGEVLGSLAFGDLRRSVREYVKNIQYAFVGDTTIMPRDVMLKR